MGHQGPKTAIGTMTLFGAFHGAKHEKDLQTPFKLWFGLEIDKRRGEGKRMFSRVRWTKPPHIRDIKVICTTDSERFSDRDLESPGDLL